MCDDTTLKGFAYRTSAMRRSTGKAAGLGKADKASAGVAADTRRYACMYAVVRRIPRGRVATYGQVAALAGFPGRARQAGYALHALPVATSVPWHRVVNAAGRISARAEPGADLRQRVLLEAEGVAFDGDARIRLDVYQWRPRPRLRYAKTSTSPSPRAPKPRRGGAERKA
jgi:methylated-DNA-protein-cysteine methyltransferase-like protein